MADPVRIAGGGGAEGLCARLDQYTSTLQMIEYGHHEVHSGDHFFFRSTQTLSINQVIDFTWLMPNTTKWTHWVWDIETGSEMAWYVYESAVVTNALANAITIFNNNRNSAKVSGTTMKYEIQANLTAANGDTDVTGATLIESGVSGSGRSGAIASRDSELILKQNALYCMRAVATAAGFINFNIQWYEHQNIA